MQRDYCTVMRLKTNKGSQLVPNMHGEAQDQSAAGWGQVTDLIERLAQTSAPILEPSAQIPWEDWMRVITLPPQVASLTHVVEIRLYGSHLRRLPPETARMTLLR